MTEVDPSDKIKFYTTGFAGRDISELKPMLDRTGAMLVDVRFSPNDGEQPLRWRQIYLKALLREKYRHISHSFRV